MNNRRGSTLAPSFHRTVLLCCSLLLLMGCPPPPPPIYTFTPRIGDNPATPQVTALDMKLQLTTRVSVPGAVVQQLPLFQELRLTHEFYRNGQLIATLSEHRYEASITDAQGDWADDHQNNSAKMAMLNADKMIYRVHAELMTATQTAGPPQMQPGIFRAEFDVDFGPAATAAERQALQNTPTTLDPGFRFTRDQTAIIYTIHWEVNKTVKQVEGRPPVVTMSGTWGIAFWTPLSAFGLNQHITF